MEIPLVIDRKMYDVETTDGWKSVWNNICEMAYERTGICEKIITKPGYMRVNGVEDHSKNEGVHSRVYLKKDCVNDFMITLDTTWKFYSAKHGPKMPYVIPELKEIHVPRILFETIGVKLWFNHSFPNCRIFFWDE